MESTYAMDVCEGVKRNKQTAVSSELDVTYDQYNVVNTGHKIIIMS